jgi:hypothetical protein
MLTIERLARDFEASPGLVKVGVIGLLLSGFDDVSLHLASGSLFEPIGQAHALTPDELAAHLAAFVSMVFILAGVVLDGVRRSRGAGPRTTTKERRDAVR